CVVQEWSSFGCRHRRKSLESCVELTPVLSILWVCAGCRGRGGCSRGAGGGAREGVRGGAERCEEVRGGAERCGSEASLTLLLKMEERERERERMERDLF